MISEAETSVTTDNDSPGRGFFMPGGNACICMRHCMNGGRPCGPGKDGADAPSLSHRLRFLSPGRCLSVFSLCFLLLSVLLCCSCFSGFLFLKVKDINSLMAPFDSPAVPGRRAPLR